MSESYPTRPGDLPQTVSLRELANGYHRHSWALREHHHRYGAADPRGVVEHCLAALAYGGALAERASAGRCAIAVDALAAGASAEQVAKAMDCRELDDMRMEIGIWASNQRRFGLIDEERHEQVLALLREAWSS